ncbi:MAG: sigma-70 family RNA polymerase sigma factor [Cyclobacteriaceae bacterium]|nr:sigma-70 family RNA polymerase sigma factor [Cyclobacteriaceae bacterium]
MELRLLNYAVEKKDLEIWSAFVQGDKEAFAVIYRNSVKNLYNYGMKVSDNSELVEEAIQDLFVELWERRERLSLTDNINFYLLKALRFKIIRLAENEKRRVTQLNSIKATYLCEHVLPFEEILIREQLGEERKMKLFTALAKLPARQKEVLHLLFFEKYSYEEISKIMDLNLRSVYTLAWKSIATLKKNILCIVFTIASWVF